MKCSNPLQVAAGTVGCGQCMSCRINRSRLWTARLLQESQCHPPELTYFVTFTYADDQLHLVREADGTLSATLEKTDGRLFRKRLDQEQGGKLRFFWVGEYGEKTHRPHYHAVFFGFKLDPEAFARQWPHGHVLYSWMTPSRAAYVAQYCTKKMTQPDDTRLGSRHPEFAQMSRRPALGDAWCIATAEWLRKPAGRVWLAHNHDVPNCFRFEGSLWPIGDRHKRILRQLVGLPELKRDVIALDPEAESVRELPDLTEIQRRRAREAQRSKRKKIKQSATARV